MQFNLENSAVNTAIASSILDMSSAQKLVASAVFGLSKKLSPVNTDDYKTVDKETKKSIELLTATTQELAKKFDEANKVDEESKETPQTTIQALSAVATTLGTDPKSSKRFNESIDNLSNFIDNVDKKSASTDALFKNLSELHEKYSVENFAAAGKAMIILAGGVAAMGVAIWTLTHTVTPQGVLAAGAILGSVWLFAKAMTDVDNSKLTDTTLNISRLAASITFTALSIALISLLPQQSILRAAGIFIVLTGTIAASSFILEKLGTEKVGDRSVSWAPAIIAGSLSILALGIFAFNQIVKSPSDLIMPMGTIIGLTLALALINMIPGKGGIEGATKGLLYATASIAVLALAIMVWDEIQPEQVFKPVIAIGLLAISLGLMSKLGGENGVKGAGANLLIASASIAVLAVAIKLWDVLGIDGDMILLPGLAIGGIMVGLTAMSKIGGPTIMQSALALAVTGASIGIVAFALKMFDSVTIDSMTHAGLFITGLGAGLALLGQVGPQALMAAAALGLSGLAIIAIGAGLKSMSAQTPEQMIQSGIFVAGLGGVLALLGLAPWALIGAASLGAGGLALYSVGRGLAAFKGVDFKQTDAILDVISKLSDKFYDIGGPIDAVMIGSGAAVMTGVGLSTLLLSKTLRTIHESKLTGSQIQDIGDGIGLFIDSLLDTIQSRQGSFLKTAIGIKSLSGLGSMISNLASGLVQMGKLTFVEYGIQDGKLVPITTRKFTQKDFDNVAIGIDAIISSLHAPLAKIGEDGNFLTGGPVGRGIKQLNGLGSLVKGVVDGIAGIGQMQFTEYAVRDGRLVPISTRNFRRQDFVNVGVNLGLIIDSLTKPLAKIGADSGMLSDSDVKNGIDSLEGLSKTVFKPIFEIVKFIQDNKINAASNKELAVNISGLIGGVFGALSTINDYDAEDVPDILAGINSQFRTMVSYNADYGRMSTHFKRTAGSLMVINKELSNEKLQKILQLRDAIKELSSYQLHNNFEKLIELIELRLQPLLTQMNDTLSSTADYAMSQNQAGGYDMSAFNSQPMTGQNVNITNNNSNTVANNTSQNNDSSLSALADSISDYADKLMTFNFLK